VLGAVATVALLAASIAGAGCGDSAREPASPEPRDVTETSGAGGGEQAKERRPAPSPTNLAVRKALRPEKALGQLLVGRYGGDRPPASFLSRVRAGELGGVILFADNVEGGSGAVRRTIQGLQRAAVGSGNPPLLVFVDQEGGAIKRLPGPPDVAPRQIESTGQAFRQGELTGLYLRGLGINVDLAPVVDVPTDGSFIHDRAFGVDPVTVAERACAFARGLLAEGVAATLKHFPGLGRALSNTDSADTAVTASAAALRSDYVPYRACGSDPLTLTMLSSARYPALTGALPAVMATETYSEELPRAGASGLTISDDLEAPALATAQSPAATAIEAGLNLALYAKTEAGSADAHSVLSSRLERGAPWRESVVRNARPVLALKSILEPELTARFVDEAGDKR
jgi:beta-N-acetylhexosaminidase